jgi:ribonuclease-3 family protein
VNLPALSRDIRDVPVSVLAYIGDAVYEVYVRFHNCNHYDGKSGQLHRRSVSIVKAHAQAEAARRLMPSLNAEETAVFKRGRNSQPLSRSRHADPLDYVMATGLEALIGYLSLKQEDQRLAELMNMILEDQANEQKNIQTGSTHATEENTGADT